VKGDELYQLFVSAQSRGSGSQRTDWSGVETAWLACAIGNERAARFYEKSGWRRAGTMMNLAETSNGLFPLEVWRYEKTLTRQPDLGSPYECWAVWHSAGPPLLS
jgi:hypothetical protein